MMWVIKLFTDFFMSLGAMVFFWALYTITFKAGETGGSVNIVWFIIVPMLFAWVRGEVYHWPKELEKK